LKKLIATFSLLLAGYATAYAGSTHAIKFNGEEYSYRATENALHQFTPADEADLASRTEMVSFTFTDEVKNKEDLKGFAEKFLAGYNGKGKIIRAIAGPNPRDPEMFFMAAMTSGEKHSEANMFLLSVKDAKGVVMNYSHRFYGKDQSKAVMDWFNANGPALESSVMSFQDTPSAADFK